MRFTVPALAGAATLTIVNPASAQFTPLGSPTISGFVAVPQTVNGATVTATGTVQTTGLVATTGSTAVTVTGGSASGSTTATLVNQGLIQNSTTPFSTVVVTGRATVTNSGTIRNAGSGPAIMNGVASAILSVSNTGQITAFGTDAFRILVNSQVTLTNSGTISTAGSTGSQAIDWSGITSKSNALTNQSTGVISAAADDAVRLGTNGVLTNEGTISATSGRGVQGGGRSTITNSGTISSTGSDAVRTNFLSTITNSGTIAATPTGTATPSAADGIGVSTSTAVTVINSGAISGRHGISAQSAGLTDTQTIDNKAGGTITGLNGSGVFFGAVATNITMNISNAEGATIQGGVLSGATSADGDGIHVGATLALTNRGYVLGRGARTITGNPQNNPEAISMVGGTVTNTATGRIVGSADIADAPNGDPAAIGSGILVHDGSGGNAAAATTNAGLIQGKTGFATRIVGSFADTVTNQAGGIMRGNTADAAVETGSGNDTVTNAGTIENQGTGAALSLGDGDDTLTLNNGAIVNGNIDGGAGTDTLVFDLGPDGRFDYAGGILNFESIRLVSGTLYLTGASARVFGDQTGNADFLNLIDNTRVDGQPASYSYDGERTYIVQAVTATPEPASIVILAAGLAGLGTLRRRRA